MAKGKKTGGRIAGTPNKVTREIREAAKALLETPAYQASLKKRLVSGKAPHMETLLHYYGYGKPKDTFDTPGIADLAAALSRKVVDELHPGPTKSPSV